MLGVSPMTIYRRRVEYRLTEDPMVVLTDAQLHTVDSDIQAGQPEIGEVMIMENQVDGLEGLTTKTKAGNKKFRSITCSIMMERRTNIQTSIQCLIQVQLCMELCKQPHLEGVNIPVGLSCKQQLNKTPGSLNKIRTFLM